MTLALRYLEGIDCTWVACDLAGHVGAFTTGGEGPIPHSAFTSATAEPNAEERLISQPKLTTPRLIARYPRPDDYIAFAERGIFAFDWSDVHRTASNPTRMYQTISVPASPIHVEQLPLDLQAFAKATVLNVLFSQSESCGIGL